jgi:hypothetical protein
MVQQAKANTVEMKKEKPAKNHYLLQITHTKKQFEYFLTSF